MHDETERRMKAIRLEHYGGPEALSFTQVPELAPVKGQALVRSSLRESILSTYTSAPGCTRSLPLARQASKLPARLSV